MRNRSAFFSSTNPSFLTLPAWDSFRAQESLSSKIPCNATFAEPAFASIGPHTKLENWKAQHAHNGSSTRGIRERADGRGDVGN